MKKSINRNIAAAEYFVNLLSKFGVKDVCISPGSRSTPLTVAFSRNRKIRTHVIVDERASCFFALGLARQSKAPVAVVTTSGTAAAELTPGIVEAFFSRTPLIICTADRPAYLLNRGANQVINQRHMFANHTIGYYDTGLPKVSPRWFDRLSRSVSKKIHALSSNPGPLHFNMPFEKPFEPGVSTDEIDDEIKAALGNVTADIAPFHSDRSSSKTISKKLIERIAGSKKIVLSVGPLYNDAKSAGAVAELARKFNSIIAADGLARNNFNDSAHLIVNFGSICRSSKFRKLYDPDLIIHFGYGHTSNSMLEFYRESAAYKIAVNPYGDKIDPSRTTDTFVKMDPVRFCGELSSFELKNNGSNKNKWCSDILKMDQRVQAIKEKLIFKKRFPFEGRILHEVYSVIPEKSNLILSNSLPVRDFDNFADAGKDINVYCSRGASGIDGIISTACGASVISVSPSTLVIGDLAFYHDLNSLYLCGELKKPLVIILINNGGGAIFEMLPIYKEKVEFEKYFKTPVKIDFGRTAQAFNLNYTDVKNWAELKTAYNKALRSKSSSVIEIKTNSIQSLELRKKYWEESISTVDKMIHENKSR